MPPYRLIHRRSIAIINPVPEFLRTIDREDASVVLGEWPDLAPSREERRRLVAEYLSSGIHVLRQADSWMDREIYESAYIQFQERRTIRRTNWLKAKILGPTTEEWQDIEKWDLGREPEPPNLRIVN